MSQFRTPKGTELPLLDMRGKPYLQVAHRLVWMREEQPLWGIETSFVVLEADHAIARALIRDEAGRLLSTAHKREDKGHFPDFMEKAETGALGRALAMVGYGTQFVGDELDEGARIADSPIAPARITQIDPTLPKNSGPTSYRVPFGKYKGKGLAQLESEFGRDAIDDYCDWMTNEAVKKGKPLGPDGLQFIALWDEHKKLAA